MTTDLTFRPMSEEEPIDDLARTLALAFGESEESTAGWIESTGRSPVLLAESGGSLAGALLSIPMAQYFGGRSIPMAGIAGVAVAPEYRGRGVATRTMAHALGAARERGVPLSGLYSAKGPLYRRVGYEFAGLFCEHRLPLGKIELESAAAGAASLRGYTENDFESVCACYARYASGRDGHLDRGTSPDGYIWDRVIRGRTKAKVHGFVVEEAGAVTGYLFYLHAPGDRLSGPGTVLAAPDICATTPGSAQSLLRFLAEHRSTQHEVWWFGAVNHPLFDVLSDEVWKSHIIERWMLRILDVPGALRGRGYRAGINVGLTLRVRDELFGENQGPWSLKIANGAGTVEPGDDGDAISLDIRALAALYSGFRSATELAAAGLLEGDEGAIARADTVFSGPVPTMIDGF